MKLRKLLLKTMNAPLLCEDAEIGRQGVEETRRNLVPIRLTQPILPA